MIRSDVVIVGAGPAGSTCAWKLKQAGVSVRLLDRHTFPRLKLCAGWVTPSVFSDLQTTPDHYPYGIREMKQLHIHVKGVGVPMPTRQYSIRRLEFDQWLLERSDVTFHQHYVKSIEKRDQAFIIDNTFSCRYLVGAGGTGCPVYRTFFKQRHPRNRFRKITTLELEFPYRYRDQRCYLWFLDHGLPGYAWYVPKQNGYLNIGIGGKFEGLKRRQMTIREYWQRFVRKLAHRSLVTTSELSPKGYNYFLRDRSPALQYKNAFLLGDAAGLATMDMGEGIGPAIRSGILAANAIVNDTPYSVDAIGRYSIIDILRPGKKSRGLA